MTRAELEARLRLPILTVCWAVLAKEDGGLKAAVAHLTDEIETLLAEERKQPQAEAPK